MAPNAISNVINKLGRKITGKEQLEKKKNSFYLFQMKM